MAVTPHGALTTTLGRTESIAFAVSDESRTTMTELLEVGRAVLAEQPFSVLLGTCLTKLEVGSAELSLTVADAMKQQHGFVHGGVISYLADNCLTFAGGSLLGDSVTSEFKINYLRPAVGDELVAKGLILSSGKNQAVCQCRVLCHQNGDEMLVAVAQGSITKVETTER